MQVSYNRLKNPSKNLWCNRQAKRDRQKLVNLVVPDKSEKFPGSQRNWDMEISIRKVQFGGQHTWKNTSSDRSVGLHFEMGNRKITVQNREIYHRSHSPRFLGNQEETRIKPWSEEFPLLLFTVIEIELLLTEDGTSPCLRSET
jgi:hypothetical protein